MQAELLALSVKKSKKDGEDDDSLSGSPDEREPVAKRLLSIEFNRCRTFDSGFSSSSFCAGSCCGGTHTGASCSTCARTNALARPRPRQTDR